MTLHLRYPNAHTHWFISLMLHLFTEIQDDRFKGILTRVLLEHLMVHRPHPWGVIVTFVELLRNPKYEFWSHGFIRVAPEITLIMESVCQFFLYTGWILILCTGRKEHTAIELHTIYFAFCLFCTRFSLFWA